MFINYDNIIFNTMETENKKLVLIAILMFTLTIFCSLSLVRWAETNHYKASAQEDTKQDNNALCEAYANSYNIKIEYPSKTYSFDGYRISEEELIKSCMVH